MDKARRAELRYATGNDVVNECLDAIERLEALAALKGAALAKVEQENDAMQRELERWRHGKQIEGYYVCEAALERDALRTELAALKEVRQHGCECSDEDACLFARQRNFLRADNEWLRADFKNADENARRWCEAERVARDERDALRAQLERANKLLRIHGAYAFSDGDRLDPEVAEHLKQSGAGGV